MNTFCRSRIRLGSAAIAAASVVSLVACASSERFETVGGGHPIVAYVTGPLTIESRETHATIAARTGVVTVEPTRTRIDDGSWTTISENVPVQVVISKHAISIQAGSVTVSRTIR